MASRTDEVVGGGGGATSASTTTVPEDPPRRSAAYSLSYVPLRGLSLLLLIVAILLCLEGMELGFLAFIILGLLFEVVDLVCGLKHLQQIWDGVDRCIGQWRALKGR